MTHPEYPVLRKIFLQWIFALSLVELNIAENFYAELINEIDFGSDEDNEKDFRVFVEYCQKPLNQIHLDLIIHSFVEPNARKEFIGIKNIKSDCISHVATKLNADSIDCFKKIIIGLKGASNHELCLTEIEKIACNSRIHAQALLSDLKEKNWISNDTLRGTYFLGPRSLFELDEFLKNRIEDTDEGSTEFESCQLCTTLICCGPKLFCENSDCKVPFHNFCISEYFDSTGKLECPKCRYMFNNKSTK